MEITLKGKRAFISGAATGIGRATALSMHELGAEVMICDIDVEKLNQKIEPPIEGRERN